MNREATGKIIGRAFRHPPHAGDLMTVLVEDLAPVMGHDPAGIKINIIGAKPGEKLYEELISEEEKARTVVRDGLYVILPDLGTAPYAGLRRHTDQGVRRRGFQRDRLSIQPGNKDLSEGAQSRLRPGFFSRLPA